MFSAGGIICLFVVIMSASETSPAQSQAIPYKSPRLRVSVSPRQHFPSPRLPFSPSPRLLLQAPQPKPPVGISAEASHAYVGRYELESGLIPISTLDVTFDNHELWIKPSVLKKRRIISKRSVAKSESMFLDEVSGTIYKFNKDEEGKVVNLTFQYEDAEYIAQKVELPPPSLKGNTTFRLKGYESANIVALSGSFNDWSQSQFIFGREEGEWVCRINLEPGKHAYKFIVDGNWILDPANPFSEDDDYGVKNSVIIVAKAPQAIP
jgi:hypothetical protein